MKRKQQRPKGFILVVVVLMLAILCLLVIGCEFSASFAFCIAERLKVDGKH